MFKQGIRFVCVQNPDKEIRTKKYGVWIKSESIPDQAKITFGFCSIPFRIMFVKMPLGRHSV